MKQELMEYKKIVEELQKYKISDEKLSLMAKGVIPYPEGFPTGYPSLDKSWLKFFDSDFLSKKTPSETIYDYMTKCVKGYESYTAISYFGNEISYEVLDENIKKSSKALTALGVEDSDRIMYLMPNIPETAYLLYGGSRIGAVSDYIDPRPDSINKDISAQKVLNMIKNEKCKYIIALEQCYLSMLKPIENELKELGIEQIVVVSAQDSMNKKATINYINQGIRLYGVKKFLKKLKETEKLGELYKEAIKSSPVDIINYQELVNNSLFEREVVVPYSKDKNVIITHTSGTSSSVPKPIPATHDNMNAFAFQSFGAKMKFAPGYRVLHILPYFASFGVTDIVHAGLCHATNLIEIPEVEIDKFGKIVHLNKGEVVVGLPCWYNSMTKDKYLNNKKLDYLKYVSYGGTSMEVSDELKFNEMLKKHGSDVVMSKGHGMSEVEGCASNATDDFNVEGTIGIPMPKTTYCIVDPETKISKRFKSKDDILHGEVAISSDALSSCELDGIEYAKFTEIFGEKYILSGDLGKMNYNGIMTFDSRMDRGFPRYDGFNVRSSEIEKIIKQDKRIKYCVIVPFYDEEKMGNMIKANIVLDDDVQIEDKAKFIEDLVQKCFVLNPNVSSRQIPSKFLIRDEIPLTVNGKEDYKLLSNEQLSGEEITIEFDETNISINGIKVIEPKTVRKVLKK